MKQVKLLIILSLLFCSCNILECEKLELTQKETKWYNNFVDGELKVYESDIGNNDTLVCAIKKDGYLDCNRLERSEYKQREIYINFYFVGNKGDKYNKDITLMIDKYYKDKSASICFYTFSQWWCGHIKEVKGGHFNSEDYNVKNKSSSQTKIKSFIWVGSLGLTSYVLQAGEEYKLVTD
jgi:hypothetical protein